MNVNVAVYVPAHRHAARACRNGSAALGASTPAAHLGAAGLVGFMPRFRRILGVFRIQRGEVTLVSVEDYSFPPIRTPPCTLPPTATPPLPAATAPGPWAMAPSP